MSTAYNRWLESPYDEQARHDEEHAQLIADETARLLDAPSDLAQDFPGDQALLLEQVFEILRHHRVTQQGVSDPAQRAYNDARAVNDLAQIWATAANQTAEHFN